MKCQCRDSMEKSRIEVVIEWSVIAACSIAHKRKKMIWIWNFGNIKYDILLRMSHADTYNVHINNTVDSVSQIASEFLCRIAATL